MNIYVEGNIGTGKTTFLSFLKKQIPKYNILYEPVDEWVNIKDANGKNLLEHFYEDQNKWSFPFQMNTFISRVKKIQDSNSDINIVERSVYTDRNCFATNCFNSGKMTSIEYDIYCRWHDWLCAKFPVKPNGFIYLKTAPEISHQRIKKRDRRGEDTIPLEYLQTLHKLHEKWMDDEKCNNIPVLVLDITKDIYKNETEQKEILAQVQSFISKL